MASRRSFAIAASCGAAVLAATAGRGNATQPMGFSPPVIAIPATPIGTSTPSRIAEPRVLFARDGRIFVGAQFQSRDCAIGAVSESLHSCLWVSPDNGRHYHLAGDPGSNHGDDVDLAQTDSGTLVISTMTSPGAPYASINGIGTTVSRSIDGGQTFTQAVAANHQVVNDRPFLLVDTSQNLILSYTSFPGTIYVSTSQDGGKTFGVGQPVSPIPPEPTLSFNGGPAIDRTRQEILIPFAFVPSADSCTSPAQGCFNNILLARSHDHGASWTVETVANLAPQHGPTSVFTIAADQAGAEYLVFSALDSSGHLRVMMTTQAATGKPWSRPVSIDTPSASGMLPWVLAGDAGRVAIAWYASQYPDAASTSRPWRPRFALSTDAGHTWTRRDLTSTAAYVGTGVGHGTVIYDLLGLAADATGHVAVCWTTVGNTGNRIDCSRQRSGSGLRRTNATGN